MKTIIPVELPQNRYSIAIATGGLADLGQSMVEYASAPLGKKVLLVSNSEIFEHYGELVLASLMAAGFAAEVCILPAGESAKTLASVQQVYDAAIAQRLERSSTLVALGGGVIGDMTGFAAATWLRGINFVQVPTTLLAMVDASIGGKTGVNHPEGKNLIGAFYQPRLVLIDPLVLKTLPEREFRAGMAEVIKYGVIWSSELFEALEGSERLDSMAAVSPELLESILVRSCGAKAVVVSRDEREADLRAILNYGHTVAHAVESLTGYTEVNHGEAVGIGMVAAGNLAVALGLWDGASNARQLGLVVKAGLPQRMPTGVAIADILATLQTDKKVKAGKVRFVLPTRIGEVVVTDEIPEATLVEVLKELGAVG